MLKKIICYPWKAYEMSKVTLIKKTIIFYNPKKPEMGTYIIGGILANVLYAIASNTPMITGIIRGTSQIIPISFLCILSGTIATTLTCKIMSIPRPENEIKIKNPEKDEWEFTLLKRRLIDPKLIGPPPDETIKNSIRTSILILAILNLTIEIAISLVVLKVFYLLMGLSL